MEAFIQQVVSGLATGSIYASLALALVMIYQATAPRELRAGRDGDVRDLHRLVACCRPGVPYWVAFFVTVGDRLCAAACSSSAWSIRPVENAPILAIVIVFIGLLVIFNSLAGWIYSLHP